MAEKLQSYQGFLGRFHSWRESAREWRENRSDIDPKTYIRNLFSPARENPQQSPNQDADISDYSHIYRKKTGAELIRVSATVMGIEFAYAAETAFVSPTLLKIGVQHEHMTLVWALSPLIGFFMTPLLGSLSDRCRLNWGRRRPFIVLLAVGVFIGLLLVPNGEILGYAMGDSYPAVTAPQRSTGSAYLRTSPTHPRLLRPNATSTPAPDRFGSPDGAEFSRPWGVFFTILGTALLDFDADACQSPARAYLLDVTVPDDHARGLSTFTIMAGLGGFMGYALGGINWDETTLGIILGGHVRAVFTLITFIFVTCVSYTITSFKEIPLNILEKVEKEKPTDLSAIRGDLDQSYGTVVASTGGSSQLGERLKDFPSSDILNAPEKCYVNLGYEEKDLPRNGIAETSFVSPVNMIQSSQVKSERGAENPSECDAEIPQEADPVATLGQYLLSIVYMPNSLRILCLTNLFCWMAHVCYSLYFTDFVGEAVFKGDPKAPDGSESKKLYEEGVRFGCWGMSFYSLSCACYSTIIERLIKRFRARKVYVGGLLVYSTGMMLMAFSQNRFGVILFSWTAGIMYSTLFTMPYLLIAHYHSSDTFECAASGGQQAGTQLRGLGTDVAILSSMVFLAQFILSMFMGSIVSAVGSTVAVISIASFLAFCGAIAAYHVMYLQL